MLGSLLTKVEKMNLENVLEDGTRQNGGKGDDEDGDVEMTGM